MPIDSYSWKEVPKITPGGSQELVELNIHLKISGGAEREAIKPVQPKRLPRPPPFARKDLSSTDRPLACFMAGPLVENLGNAAFVRSLFWEDIGVTITRTSDGSGGSGSNVENHHHPHWQGAVGGPGYLGPSCVAGSCR